MYLQKRREESHLAPQKKVEEKKSLLPREGKTGRDPGGKRAGAKKKRRSGHSKQRGGKTS